MSSGAGRVLLAHPNNLLRALLAHVLAQAGWEVEQAACAQSVRSRRRWTGLGLLVIDSTLCEAEAEAESEAGPLLPALRQDEATARLPVLVLTGLGTARSLRQLARQGVQSVLLTETLQLASFLRKVRQMMTAATAAQPPGPLLPAYFPSAPAAGGRMDPATGPHAAARTARHSPICSPWTPPGPRLDLEAVRAACDALTPPILAATREAVDAPPGRDPLRPDQLARVLSEDPLAVLHLMSQAGCKRPPSSQPQPLHPAALVDALGRQRVHALLAGLPAAPADAHPWLRPSLLLHAVAGSRAARLLAARLALACPATAATAALVSHLGLWFLQSSFPEAWRTASAAPAPAGMSPGDLERRVIGLSREDLGLSLGRHWRLPAPVLHWLRHHSAPEADPRLPRGPEPLALLAAHAAGLVVSAVLPGRDSPFSLDRLPGGVSLLLEQAGQEADLREELKSVVRQAADDLGLGTLASQPAAVPGKLVYVCAMPPPLDPVLLAAQRDVRQVFVLDLETVGHAARGVPWLINLQYLTAPDPLHRWLRQLLRLGRQQRGLLLMPAGFDREAARLATHLGWPLLVTSVLRRGFLQALERLHGLHPSEHSAASAPGGSRGLGWNTAGRLA